MSEQAAMFDSTPAQGVGRSRSASTTARPRPKPRTDPHTDLQPSPEYWQRTYRLFKDDVVQITTVDGEILAPGRAVGMTKDGPVVERDGRREQACGWSEVAAILSLQSLTQS